VTTDYDQNYFRRAGIDIGETIRLDANDLFMSLAGPVAIAYAESVVPETPPPSNDKFKVFDKEPQRLNIDDLFFRSIDLPHFNKVTQAIEGISLLPIESSAIAASLEQYKNSGYDAAALHDLHFFKNCSSVVSIVSLPGLQAVLHGPEPVEDPPQQPVPQHHAQALCAGDRRVGQPVADHPDRQEPVPVGRLPDPDRGVHQALLRAQPVPFRRHAGQLDPRLHHPRGFRRRPHRRLLNEFENPAKILDTNWYAIKPMYEKKYRELINDKDKFVSINDIRLSRDCVKKAIKYLREIYRHRIGKTKVISLNNHTGKT
jgi:hypothetical protein